MLDFMSNKIIIIMAFLGGLGKAPTFLVPIINPPFADNSPHFLLNNIFQSEYWFAIIGLVSFLRLTGRQPSTA